MARQRLSASMARERILEAATVRFREGGVEAVKVQAIAADLGITDAAVHYHFKDRRGLLETLLRRAGRHLQREIEEMVDRWHAGGADASSLVVLIREVYDREGYATLALWLWLSGWRSPHSGMLSGLASEFDRSPESPKNEEVRFTLALLHMTIFADAIWGGEFLRSVGLHDSKALKARFDRWLEEFFAQAFR